MEQIPNDQGMLAVAEQAQLEQGRRTREHTTEPRHEDLGWLRRWGIREKNLQKQREESAYLKRWRESLPFVDPEERAAKKVKPEDMPIALTVEDWFKEFGLDPQKKNQLLDEGLVENILADVSRQDIAKNILRQAEAIKQSQATRARSDLQMPTRSSRMGTRSRELEILLVTQNSELIRRANWTI